MDTNMMAAQGTLDVFGPVAGAIGGANVAALGYLPPSLIFFRGGPNAGKLRYKQRFTYSCNFVPIAAGATTTQTTNVQPDSDFVWMASNITITDTAGTTFIAVGSAPFLIRIIDAGSGAQLMDAQVPVANLFGNAGSPMVSLGVPYIFRRGSSIQVELANQDGANARNVRIAFLGFKVYDYPAE